MLNFIFENIECEDEGCTYKQAYSQLCKGRLEKLYRFPSKVYYMYNCCHSNDQFTWSEFNIATNN